MNISVKAVLFLSISTAFGFAQTTHQIGGWSVYPGTGNQLVLLQATYEQQNNDVQGTPAPAKLDVVCKNGKVSAIAMETNVPVNRDAMSSDGVVPTTRVSFSSKGQGVESGDWAVLNGGHTLSPYSQAFQGKAIRYWIDRLASAQSVGVGFKGEAAESAVQPTFNTGNLYEALSSVGCSY
jgi:hypothetical protein